MKTAVSYKHLVHFIHAQELTQIQRAEDTFFFDLTHAIYEQ